MDVESILRDINPHEGWRSGEAFHDPSLQIRARLAQVTVRVRGETDGRGALLFLGLTHPGGCGLPSIDRLADCFVAGKGKIQGGGPKIIQISAWGAPGDDTIKKTQKLEL